jgi:hypothetical protein
MKLCERTTKSLDAVLVVEDVLLSTFALYVPVMSFHGVPVLFLAAKLPPAIMIGVSRG